jgi:hypothetical protein
MKLFRLTERQMGHKNVIKMELEKHICVRTTLASSLWVLRDVALDAGKSLDQLSNSHDLSISLQFTETAIVTALCHWYTPRG